MRITPMFAIALLLGTGAGVALDKAGHIETYAAPPAEVGEASNAAFRDGLYQGKLAAQRGGQFHISTGRWASNEDRAYFTAGYQQGYAQALGHDNHPAQSNNAPVRG